MQKRDFHYDLPSDLIAQTPLEKRTDSRLLYLDSATHCLSDRFFHEFPDMLVPGDILVFNDTRVIPARILGQKATGGQVEILVERILNATTALGYLRANKTVLPGAEIRLEEGCSVRVLEQRDTLFLLHFLGKKTVLEVLTTVGRSPLPPYIKRPESEQDRERYQTVFAKRPGAIAAPTAGLHFDEALLGTLEKRGIQTAFVTLHVGGGTFLPIRKDDIHEHVMHYEYCEVPATTVERIRAVRKQGGRVIAVGTTVVRSLETAALGGELLPYQGETNLFICPGFPFRIVDALVTNFHLPESTLLVLVSAFSGHSETLAAYRHAVKLRYRFFSYGDAFFTTRKTR